VLPLVDGDDVEKDSLIFACLDGKTWEEVIPVKSQRPSAKKHVENQRSSIKRKKQELGTVFDEMQAILKEKNISKIEVHALTGTPIVHRIDTEGQKEPILAQPPVRDKNDSPASPSDDDNNIAAQVQHDQTKDAKQQKSRSVRNRHKQPDVTRTPNVTQPAELPAPLTEQHASQDDDDAKVKEKLRQLRAQRQQEQHS
jgi:hypothetical protein